MAYDEGLAERLRDYFAGKDGVVEKKMFGGIAFMLRGNMCVGIVGETLMARVGPDQHDDALRRPHAREMDFTGRPMKGFIYVSPEGFESDEDLKYWGIDVRAIYYGGISAGIGTSTYMNSLVAVSFMDQLLKNAERSGSRWAQR